MPSIEYSPTGRASCRVCYQKIGKGCVRVGIKANGGNYRGSMDFQTQYYHAECCTNRKDFTTFYGWAYLKQTDKVKFSPKPQGYTKIADLSRPNGGRWQVQAVVTYKSPIRSWKNDRGSGKLFSVEIMDETGLDIKATFFQEAAVNNFYDKLQVGKTFIFGDGTVKSANAQYNKCKSTMEISFNESAYIEASTTSIQIPAKFIQISGVQDKEPGTCLDIVAFVLEAEDIQEFEKDGTKRVKRRLWISDGGKYKIAWTLWDDRAKAAPPAPLSFIKIYRTTLSDHGNYSLSGAIFWETVPLQQDKAKTIKNWLSDNIKFQERLHSLTEPPKPAAEASSSIYQSSPTPTESVEEKPSNLNSSGEPLVLEATTKDDSAGILDKTSRFFTDPKDDSAGTLFETSGGMQPAATNASETCQESPCKRKSKGDPLTSVANKQMKTSD